jgi:hypothetical protein
MRHERETRLAKIKAERKTLQPRSPTNKTRGSANKPGDNLLALFTGRGFFRVVDWTANSLLSGRHLPICSFWPLASCRTTAFLILKVDESYCSSVVLNLIL